VNGREGRREGEKERGRRDRSGKHESY